jgi:phosphoribosylaminoimidazole-succinocarboxamide synthase
MAHHSNNTPYIDPRYLTPVHRGKVRDTYTGGETTLDTHLIQVASDRISTHNVVHTSLIPHKGEVLTMLSLFWFTHILKDHPNHLVAWGTGIDDYIESSDIINTYPELPYRTLVVKKLNMIPVEFIFRRFLTGSLLKHYQRGEDPYGLSVPAGLTQMSRFDDVLFTPTDKSETDDPLRAQAMTDRYFHPKLSALRAYTLVEAHLVTCGISLVDTKLEFGYDADGTLCLADEVFTPDSSRYVHTTDIQEGVEPPWLDKQSVRNEVERLCAGGPIVPCTFSEEVIEETSDLYCTLLHTITGKTLKEWRALLEAHNPVL